MKTLRPTEDSKEKTIEWIKSGAMRSANYSQLQAAYNTCFGRLNLRLNKAQLKSALLAELQEIKQSI